MPRSEINTVNAPGTVIRHSSSVSSALRSLSRECIEKRKVWRFADRQYRIQVANNQTLREEAYRLVYQVYHDKGYASHQPSGLWVSLHDALPETTTLIVKDKSEMVVGALTVIFDSPLGLHADELYGEELKRLRSKGHRLCEIISLAIAPGIKDASRVMVQLINFAYLAASRIRKASDFVISVTPRHSGFYKRKLLFVQEGAAREHGKVNGTVGVLLRLDFNTASEQIQHVSTNYGRHKTRTFYKFARPKEEEPAIVRSLRNALRGMSSNERSYFLTKKTNVLQQASIQEECYLAALNVNANVPTQGASHA